MLLNFFWIFTLSSFSYNIDTSLYLPINNGKIIVTVFDSNSYCKARTGILIAPTLDSNVRSCSDGKILQVSKIDALGHQIIVKSDHIFYIYSMLDTSFVEHKGSVKKGDIIGIKNHNGINQGCILFSVMEDKVEKNPLKFVVYHNLNNPSKN